MNTAHACIAVVATAIGTLALACVVLYLVLAVIVHAVVEPLRRGQLIRQAAAELAAQVADQIEADAAASVARLEQAYLGAARELRDALRCAS